MCARFTLTVPSDLVEKLFQVARAPLLSPRYNVSPTQPVAVVRQDRETGERIMDLLRWGLIPFWAKDPEIGARMINARAETVAEKPAFRAAFRERRCLIPADGFYEWQKLGTQRQPVYVRMSDGSAFAFAGLWERWRSPDGEGIETCTLLTTQPNELLRPIHDRMPVILDPEKYSPWLDPESHRLDVLTPLLKPFPAEKMTCHPVSRYVNNPRNDDAECIRPVA
jgi:putative SOS response-associated peptidase YedK